MDTSFARACFITIQCYPLSRVRYGKVLLCKHNLFPTASFTNAALRFHSKRITTSPEICGGAPCIRGTRIRVIDIATYHEIYGWSPETIVEELEGITLADVHSALSCYFDNIEQFRKQAQEENVLIENLRKNFPSSLKKKLLGAA